MPFGLAGTVARLLADGQTAEVVFDEPFVGAITLGGRLQTARAALVPLSGLVRWAYSARFTEPSASGSSSGPVAVSAGF